MTSLDPSHLPFLANTENPRTGQATASAIPPLHSLPTPTDAEANADAEADEEPGWRGSWGRRQEAKRARKADERRRGKIPVPPIPDLRYEQGVLASIRPFIHRVTLAEGDGVAPAAGLVEGGDKEKEKAQEKEENEQELEAEEVGGMVTVAMTAEGARDGKPDIFVAPLRIEWGQVLYVIVRDQVIYPLLQGAVWGIGGLWMASLWKWNQSRLAIKSPAPPGGQGPLSRLGIHVR